MDEIIDELSEINQCIDTTNEETRLIISDKILAHINEIKYQISEIKQIISETIPADNKFEKCMMREKAISNIIFPYYWVISNLAAEIDDVEQLDIFVKNMKSYTLSMIN